MQQDAQRGLQQGQHGLGLGVTEAAVELHDRGTGNAPGEPGVEQPGEGGAAADELGGHRHDQLGRQILRRTVGQPRQRRVGAHAAGVGTEVVLAHPLEVLRGQQRHHRLAVDQAEQADLGPVEEALQQHGVAFVEQGRRVPTGNVTVVGDHDALAGGDPVVLDHPVRAEPVHGGVEPGRGVDDLAVRRPDPHRGHHVLGEGLGTLDSGRLRRRPEARDAGGPHRVGHPENQRHLGADNDEVSLDGAGQRDDGGRVHRVHGVVGGHPHGPGVARRAVQRRHPGVAPQREQQGVLTSTGTDHEDAHSRHCAPCAMSASEAWGFVHRRQGHHGARRGRPGRGVRRQTRHHARGPQGPRRTLLAVVRRDQPSSACT